MQQRLSAALALLALLAMIAGCSGSSSVNSSAPAVPSDQSAHRAIAQSSGGNVVADPGFESGGFTAGWTQCGSVLSASSISTANPHSGTYSALNGSTAKPEVNGTAGVCQTVTVPAGGMLTFWVYEGTDDTISYADQEADILSTSGTTLAQLYKEAASTGGWEQKSFSLSAYAGESVVLYFGVKGNGYKSDYIYEYVDDVSLTGSGASPTASPTSSPTAKPTSSPTAKPTSSPTAKPTSSPTAAPTSAAYACNDSQFLTYQQEFGAGSISADQLVDVCGSVTSVLPAKTTSSGTHGYFYVSIAGSTSPGTIEIVSNLDAMAEAATDDPPAWPWVAVGDYVYVQGRYYYDDSSSQGIDWTEDDTDSSWSHTGYVAVCNASGGSCVKYW